MTLRAPCPSAVTIVVVARSTSITTQHPPLNSAAATRSGNRCTRTRPIARSSIHGRLTAL